MASEFSIRDAGVRVGLEVHQQLATGKKLFCSCRPIESDEYLIKFQRRLRAAKSELGEFDPAALFEKSKSKTMSYYANPESSCLVEQDEEPPHELDEDAKKIALTVALTLESSVFSEIYPMRKTVVDGSNTAGFQRTMLISQGGFYDADGTRIGIQSICLEEDAAKILGEEGGVKKYGLGRLGVPLVEIATDPFEVEPQRIKNIALSLGRILRGTKKVRRGLGSIRQDVNVSIRDGGVVIEVKGVQQLDQLEKVVEYEAKRQHGLLKISKKIQEKNWRRGSDERDATELFSGSKSKVVVEAIRNNQKIFAMPFVGMAGMFGYEPYEDIRLGKEVAELVRFFGIGGVFHSDELPNYGIGESDVKNLKEFLGIGGSDAFLVLALPHEKMRVIVDQIISRIEHVRDSGIPIDTRLATPAGQTRFLRPRPGAARMYPETDIPPVIITKTELEEGRKRVPKSWDESLLDMQKKYGLNAQLSEQVFDSRHIELFEKIVNETKVSPTFVASVLCSLIVNLERSGLDSGLLKNKDIAESFHLLDAGKIAKESIEMIFTSIMDGKSESVGDAVRNASIETVGGEELAKIIKEIVEKNQGIVKNQKERAVGPLMGVAMKELRGKASGEAISGLLLEEIRKKLNGL